MEASIEKTENRAAHTEPSIITTKESPKPMDLSKDRMDSINSDIFEEAIEPPVQDKENGNGSHESEEKEKKFQEVFNEKMEEKNNGDLEDFESYDDTNSELKVHVGDLGKCFEEISEELETPVGNPEEKVELPDGVGNNGFNQEQESEVTNGKVQVGANGEDDLNGEDGVNGELTVGKSEPNLVESDGAQNGEDGLNGDDDVNREQTVGESDPAIVELVGAQNGEVQLSEEIPPEKLIQKSSDSLPDLIIKQEAETSNGVTGEEGINGEDAVNAEEGINGEDAVNAEEGINGEDAVNAEEGINGEDAVNAEEGINGEDAVNAEEGINGKVQSDKEIPPEKIIEESRDSDLVILGEDSSETKNGDVQFSVEEFPHEEIIKESAGTDPIMTESTETQIGELQSKRILPHDEVTQENKENPSIPIFEIDPDIIQNPVTQNTEINNGENIRSEEAPIVEEIYDSSSSSNNDEKIEPQYSVPQPVPVPVRPAGLGSSGSLPDPSTTTRSASHNGCGPASTSVSVLAQPQRQVLASDEVVVAEPEEHDEIREKLMNIRVKFLRLVHRLGQTPHNTVVAQVLYRLGLAEQLRRNSTRPVVVSFDRASVLAEQLELSGSDPLDFTCTIMLLGKAGVGKSSTINSLFNDSRVPIHTFGPGTRSVNLISGNIHGINVKIIDTPGLSPSISDMHKNTKILHSIKKFVKSSPPDIVLYFDRLDVQSRDYGDVALLQTITNVFGVSIWFNAIIVLTHAASAPPEGANGTALSYDMFVTQRTHVVQQNIRQAAGDVRLMNPVSLVENHLACRMNRAGKRVLPNGTVWEPQLLLLSFASKILGEANALLKLEDNNAYNGRGGKRVPPLPYFLSSLLQSRSVVKLPEEEQFGDLDEDLEDDLADLDEDLEDDYDDLPPFKRLSKEQLERLRKEQRKAYLDELEYREKLFFKKQLKEERRRRKMAKKMKQEEMKNNNDSSKNNNNNSDKAEGDETVDGPGSLPVLMPDMSIPASFDSDAPVHRYRYLDSNSQWLVRPVLDLHGWDHDIGYEGLNLERLFVVKNKIPVSVSGQLAKDKKESSLQLDVSSSVRHGERKASSFGLDLQAVGKDMSYTLRGETRFRNFKQNATSAGGSVTFLGDSVSGGIKIEDKLVVNKQVKVLVTGGAMTGRGDLACGGRIEATFKDRDYPIGRFLSTLALSVVDWHGELALGLNCQSQVPVGRGTNLVLNGNLNNKGSGQVAVRLNSSDQVQLALIALVPLIGYVKRVMFGSGYD